MSKKKNAKNKKSVKTVDAVEKPGVVEAWALAARPKTLAAACSPVIVGLGLAYRDIADGRAVSDVFVLVPALCCLAFALLAQVAANFINDYADFKKGADGGERKGPRRAVANGWISPRAMLTGTFVALARDASLRRSGASSDARRNRRGLLRFLSSVQRGAPAAGVYWSRRRAGRRVFWGRRGMLYVLCSDVDLYA